MPTKIAAILSMIFLQTTIGGADECPRLIGRIPDGPATAVAAEGQLAYLVSGATVQALDVSDPASPQRVGWIDAGTIVRRLTVENDLVFVVTGTNDVTLIDVSGPSGPVIASRIGGYFADVAAVDRIAFLAAGYDGLRVFDTADSEHPVEIGAVDGISLASRIDTTPSHAFVLVSTGLAIVDVSDPTDPEVVSTTPFNNYYEGDVVASGSMVFIAEQNGFHVVDVSDPTEPVVAGSLEWPFTTDIGDLAVRGDLAFVSDGRYGVRLIDVSDPTDPIQVASLESRPSGMTATAAGLLTAEWEDGLRVYDVSLPAEPVEIGSFDTPGSVRAVAVDGDRGVAVAWDGLRVFDTTDPADPIEIGAFNPADEWGDAWNATCVDLAGDHAFVCDAIDDRVVVLDISNPGAVAPVAEIDAHHLKDLAVVPPYAYIQADALYIVDVSDPTNPIQVSRTEGGGRYIALELPYLYSTSWTEGLFTGLGIFDVSDPAQPRIVGGAFSGDIRCCSKMAASESWVYILGYPDEDSSLFVVDARDPANPVVVSSTLLAIPSAIAVSGSSGLLGQYGFALGPLFELNLTDPEEPTVVGRHDTSDTPRDIALADGYGYVAEGRAGIEVFELCNAGLREAAWLEIAAHGSGKNGSEWRTDATVRNLGTVEADLELTLHADGVEYTMTNTVAARAQAVFEDVVGMMGVEDKGALEVRSSLPLSVLGRIYTEGDDGTFGQYLRGATSEDGLTIGDVAWLHGLRQLGQIWRSNLSFTNTDRQVAATVRVTLFGTDGIELTGFDLGPIAPGEVVQELAPLANRAGRPDIGWAMAKIEVVSGFGVLVSGSVIDSRTNDPTTIPMVVEE